MRHKRIFTGLSLLLIGIVYASIALASTNMLSATDNILKSIMPAQTLNYAPISQAITVYVIVAFTIFFAIIYAAASFIEIFKQHQNAKIMFSLALALIGILAPGPLIVLAKIGPIAISAMVIICLVLLIWAFLKDIKFNKNSSHNKQHQNSEQRNTATSNEPRAREAQNPRIGGNQREIPNERYPHNQNEGGLLHQRATELYRLVCEYQNEVSRYHNLTVEYITKLRKLLGEDSGYFEPREFDFDMAGYHHLMEHIHQIENKIIELIEQINSEAIENTNILTQITSYIERFEDLYAQRKEIARRLEEELREMYGA